MSDNACISGNSPRTVMAWLYNKRTSGGWAWFTISDDCHKYFRLAYRGDSHGLMVWGCANDINTGVTTDGSGNSLFPANAWHHIAATHDGTTAKYYYDSVQVYSGAYTSNALCENVNYYGGFPGGANGQSTSNCGAHSCNFYGDARGLRVFDQALGASDISSYRSLDAPSG